MTRFPSRTAHYRSLVEHVLSLARNGCPIGDIGILTPSNYGVRDIRSALQRVGIPSIDLLDYRGKTEQLVKVGTIKRAKGLEFKQVLVARTPSHLLDPSAADVDTGESERRTLDRRALYVAMTRARDGLWVGVV